MEDAVSESQIVSKKEVYTGKWLKFSLVDYSIGSRKLNNYEMVERNMDRKGRPYDGIGVAAILEGKETSPHILLIAQFRPPLNAFILELPGGIAESENILDDVNRELQEETGYYAKEVIEELSSPESYSDPGVSNSCGKLVFVRVDLDDERNRNPKQNLEQTENIKVHLVPLENLYSNVLELVEKHKYKVIDRLLMLAMGMEFAAKLKASSKK